MSDKYLVISSDCHASPPAEHYRAHLEPQHREAYDEHQAAMQKMMEQMGLVRGAASEDSMTEYEDEWKKDTQERYLQASWDPQMRDKELDGDGVAGELIFPDAANGLAGAPFGSGLASSGSSDPELVLAGARAHNRWLAELCSTSPERRAGIASAPILHDVDAAVAEIVRANESGLWGGIMIPSQWSPAPSYNDPRYDPVWATCEERNLVVHIHSGSQPLGLSMGPGMLPINMSEQWFWAARPLWVMLLGGVFDRFPKLKFAVTEDGAWWVPDLIHRMNQKFDGGHNTRKFGDAFATATKHRPGDYFGRNIFLGTSTPDSIEIERRHLIGVDAMMWGNDFPHSEGTWPHTREWINKNFHDVPEDETRKILGLNALRVYPFDAEKLAPIVDRIGMTLDDVHGTPTVATPRS